MKRYYILVLLIVMMSLSGCTYTKLGLMGFSKKEVKAMLPTAEPGTNLDPMAAVVLEVVAHPERNPIKDTTKVKGTSVKMEWILLDTITGENAIPIRVYYPKKAVATKDLPVVVFFHGGGFIHGSARGYDQFARKIARASGCLVVSVDYRLAPEFPFPAAVDDCYNALVWIEKNAHLWGGDSSKLVVCGDSAGGNLATVTTLKAHDEKGPDIDLQLLWYPGLNLTDEITQSKLYFTELSGREYLISETFLREVQSAYVPDSAMWRNPYASPVYAPLNNSLPPAFIVTCECDPLRDDGRTYAARLRKADVPVTFMEVEGMVHAFMSIGNVFPQSRKTFKQSGAYIKDYFGY